LNSETFTNEVRLFRRARVDGALWRRPLAKQSGQRSDRQWLHTLKPDVDLKLASSSQDDIKILESTVQNKTKTIHPSPQWSSGTLNSSAR